MPGLTTLRLLNADGYTRMWNPDDYPISANSPEAYNIECNIEGTMFSENAGSDMNLYITVYDHQPGSITDVYVEAKDLSWVTLRYPRS